MVSAGLVDPSPEVLRTWSISPDLCIEATWKTGNNKEKMEEIYPQTFPRMLLPRIMKKRDKYQYPEIFYMLIPNIIMLYESLKLSKSKQNLF